MSDEVIRLDEEISRAWAERRAAEQAAAARLNAFLAEMDKTR